MNEMAMLNKRRVSYIVLITSLIATLFLTTYYSFVCDSTNEMNYGIKKYKVVSELQYDLDAIWEQKIEMVNSELYDDEVLAALEQKESIYQYIVDNKMSYGSFVIYTSLDDDYLFNWISYLNWTLNSATFVLLISLAVLAAVLFSMDFQLGTYRLLYQKKSRRLIVEEKCIAYLLWCVFLFFLSLVAIIICGSVMLRETDSYKILIYYSEKVFAINMYIYILLSAISWFFTILQYALIFITINLICRNIYFSLFAECIFTAITIVFNLSNISWLFSDIFRGQYLTNTRNLFEIISIFIVKYVLIIITLFLGIQLFSKRDMK